ncbi:MAG: hypothetical protein GZ088_06760 [Acidipila sp.]|nr:hypothetical protein [Acidipila sp.]
MRNDVFRFFAVISSLGFSITASSQVTKPDTQLPAISQPKIRNVTPEEMWKRVTQCVFPTYPGLALNSKIAGTVDIALGISPEGEIANHRVLTGPPLLVQAAIGAILQWKFLPDQLSKPAGAWSRVRALVRFNADGTTVIDLTAAILADDFGDPGIPDFRNSEPRTITKAIARPTSSPACKSEQPWTGAQSSDIEAGETNPGSYRNRYFGISLTFPSGWQTADRATLDAMYLISREGTVNNHSPMSPNVDFSPFPTHLLFFARTAGPIEGSGPSVRIWAEKQPFGGADQYFANSNFLRDKTADGTRGPEPIEINGIRFYRADRWGKLAGGDVYQIRLVTYRRDLILGIEIVAGDRQAAEQLWQTVKGMTINRLLL